MKTLPNTERAVTIVFSDGSETMGWYRSPRKGNKGKWMHSIKNNKIVVMWREL